MDTYYVGYDYKPAGHQKIDYVIYSQPIQVQSYGGYGHGGYDNKGYKSKSYGYDNKGYDKGYETKGYDKDYKSSY